MAKGRLTKTEKYIIEGMHKDKAEIADIANELGRTEATVKKYIDQLPKPESKSKPKKKKNKPPKTLKAKDLIVNQTMAKREKGVAIMTEAASSRADATRDVTPHSRFFAGAVQKINPDE